MDYIKELTITEKESLLDFAQRLIRIPSYTGSEKKLAICVKQEMEKLGYDQILEDSLGNVLGVIGNGAKKIMFDSHMDTVVVNDADDWSIPPFSGQIVNGKLYGRGSVDMKSALAAMVYSGYIVKKSERLHEKTIYVSASVMEEDYDGYALGSMIDELKLDPDYMIICEPSDGKVAIGQRGRALLSITTKGISCHGSTPENGQNAVYEMGKIIKRVEQLNNRLEKVKGERGSVALTRIESDSVSLNAVPNISKIYLDRRLAIYEDYEAIYKEMNQLIADTNAEWEICILDGLSYTGKSISMRTFMDAWEISQISPLAQVFYNTYSEQFNKNAEFFKWGFSTNGYASAIRGIPTIGYGPGEIKLCHMRDEHCSVDEIINASIFYAKCIKNL